MRKSLKIAVVIVLFFGLLFSVIGAFSFEMIVSDTLPEDYGRYNIPTLERIYKNSDFNVHYMDIFEGNIFVIGENVDSKNILVKCLDGKNFKEKWSTDVADFDIGYMTIFDTYLFIGTHHSGEMMILGNSDGRIIKTINLSDLLGISDSLEVSTAKIYPPIQVSSKIYCRYRLSINDDEFMSGVLSLAIGDFTLFFSKEYGDLFFGDGFEPKLVTDGDFGYGLFQDNGVENLIQIGPFGTLTEMQLSDKIDNPYFDKDTLEYYAGNIYTILQDRFDDETYLVAYDIKRKKTLLENISLWLEDGIGFKVNEKYIVVAESDKISVFDRLTLKLLKKFESKNIMFADNYADSFYIDDNTIYIPVTDDLLGHSSTPYGGDIYNLAKLDIETGEVVWVDKNIEILCPGCLSISEQGFYTLTSPYGTKGEHGYIEIPLSKFIYSDDKELIENLSSGILDGEVTDKCAHEMKLQIGNRYWATNGYMIEKPLDTAPVVRHDRTFIEIRSIAEKAGASIFWVENEKVVIIKGQYGEYIELKIGSPIALVGKKEVQIDEAGIIPFIENGRTMLPLRFVSESLGLVVGWDAKKKIITLLYENPECIE